MRDGPRRFGRDFTCPDLLRIPLSFVVKSYTGLSPSLIHLSGCFYFDDCLLCRGPSTPYVPKHIRFGLLRFRSPLQAQSLLFSFPAGTEMFQFPAFASRLLQDDTPSTYRVAPFGHPGVKRLFAPNPGFSQLVTSFFASESLGIHRLPLFACFLFLVESGEWKVESYCFFNSQLSTLNFQLFFCSTCSCFLSICQRSLTTPKSPEGDFGYPTPPLGGGALYYYFIENAVQGKSVNLNNQKNTN